MVSWKKRSVGSMIFDSLNMLLIGLFSLLCLVPFLYVLAASLSDATLLNKYKFIIFPVGFTLKSYKYCLLSSNTIGHSLVVSVGVTIVGTLIDLAFTSMMAYPLSHNDVFGYPVIIRMILVTMVFGGGMIPSYIVISKLGLLNTYASVIIPGSVGAENVIIFMTFFRSLPRELEEAAKIDGCTDWGIFLRIVLPTSTPLLATFALMFGVGHWNSWFDFLLYINNSKMWPVQVVLQTMIQTANSQIGQLSQLQDADYVPPSQVVQDCIIMIATVPILCVYPFLQKYFTKGIMLGSVKG